MNLFAKTEQGDNLQTNTLQSVNEICALVNTAINEQDLLDQSLQKTMRLFRATRASFFILSENGKSLTLRSASGMLRAEQEKMVKEMGEGIVGHVAKRKVPIVVNDIENDDRFHDFKARESYKTPSFICAPLMIKDKLIGVINIADKESGLCFTSNEMQLLDFVSTQIALNYRRIELYQKFKNIVKETQTLNDRLGKSDQEVQNLKKQIHINERLATIGKLAGGIAHEFNNPLDGVIRYTNLCLDHTKNDDVLKDYLLEIKYGLNRMANIVRNLLACSRNESLSSEHVNFKQILERSIKNIYAEIEHKDIRIERKLADDIPLIRDLGLERILVNLLRNAVEAISPSNGGKIIVEAQCEKENLQIRIHDTGTGIPTIEIEKIFDPFYTTKALDKGCGLGLTIVAEIVKSYNGKIQVESKIDKGTSFLVTLPLE